MAEKPGRPDDVCVVGFGARTSLGENAAASAAAVRAGVPAFAEHPFMIDRHGEPMRVARDAAVPEESEGTDRVVELAARALLEAAGALAGPRADEKPPVFLALSPDRPGRPGDLDAKAGPLLAERVRKPFGLGEVATFPAGHAAGFLALEEAIRIIRQGKIEWCFAGGADSYLEPVTLEWLDEREQLKSEAHTWGFIPGEGAGFLALALRRTAERRGWKPLASVASIGTGREEHLIHTDSVCLGRGLTEALQGSLRGLEASGEKVDHTYCDLNGQPYRSDEFGYATTRVGRGFRDVADFTAPADCWGDVGAASGPLLAILAIVSGVKGCSRGPRALAWTSSDAGERSAALFRLEPLSEEGR